MSTEGITTIVSRSAIIEKVQEVTDRASENKQQAMTAVAQQKSEKKTKTVHDPDKADRVDILRHNENAGDNPGKKKKKQGKEKNGSVGKILDLKA